MYETVPSPHSLIGSQGPNELDDDSFKLFPTFVTMPGVMEKVDHLITVAADRRGNSRQLAERHGQNIEKRPQIPLKVH